MRKADEKVLLRTYSHVAHQEHFCDICCRYILPGEFYQGEVYIANQGLIVFKTHINPSCDFPPPEDEEYSIDSKNSNNKLEGLVDNNNSLSEAA